MIRRFLAAAVFGATCFFVHFDSIAGEADCDDLLFNRDARIELKSATSDAKGDFVGEFEFHNATTNTTFRLNGRRQNGRFAYEYPDAFVEFKDLNGQWRSLLGNPGIFLTGPDTLEIPPQARRSFIARLPSSTVATSASEFRLQVQTETKGRCFTSIVFEVLPKRATVEGFRSKRE